MRAVSKEVSDPGAELAGDSQLEQFVYENARDDCIESGTVVKHPHRRSPCTLSAGVRGAGLCLCHLLWISVLYMQIGGDQTLVEGWI